MAPVGAGGGGGSSSTSDWVEAVGETSGEEQEPDTDVEASDSTVSCSEQVVLPHWSEQVNLLSMPKQPEGPSGLDPLLSCSAERFDSSSFFFLLLFRGALAFLGTGGSLLALACLLSLGGGAGAGCC